MYDNGVLLKHLRVRELRFARFLVRSSVKENTQMFVNYVALDESVAPCLDCGCVLTTFSYSACRLPR